MKIYKSQNTRRFKRLQTGYLMKYQVAGAEGEPFFSNLKDLSAGGLKFWTDQFIPESTLLKVSVWVPPIDRQVEALARVTRVRQSKTTGIFYVAVRFIEVSQETQSHLNDFIEHLATLPDARSFVSDRFVVKRREFARF